MVRAGCRIGFRTHVAADLGLYGVGELLRRFLQAFHRNFGLHCCRSLQSRSFVQLSLVIFEDSTGRPRASKNRAVASCLDTINVPGSYIEPFANLPGQSQRRQQSLHISIETRVCQERGNWEELSRKLRSSSLSHRSRGICVIVRER